LKSNLKILITAGPTREFIDPVRFLSNPSSGKMGYALAEEALKRGHRVVLISGPTSLIPPPLPSTQLIRVTTAQEMYHTVMKEARRASIIIMTAAVSDYRPIGYSQKKIKKGKKKIHLTLTPTRDILKELGQKKRVGQILVGFAAETDHLVPNAMKKLRQKNLDLIVANHVGPRTKGGFENDKNQAILLSSLGKRKKLPTMTKKKMASEIFSFLFSHFI